MSGRTRAEIISLLLDSAEKGATKTALMYNALLSFEALEEYLRSLCKEGLLEYLRVEMKFRTTENGRVFLLSQASASKVLCSHQCTKCGLLYECDQPKCQQSFQHGVCKKCIGFFSRGYTAEKLICRPVPPT